MALTLPRNVVRLVLRIAISVLVMGAVFAYMKHETHHIDYSTVPPFEHSRIARFCGVDVNSISFERTVRDQVGNPVRLFNTSIGEVIYFRDGRGICPDGSIFPR